MSLAFSRSNVAGAVCSDDRICLAQPLGRFDGVGEH